MQLKFSLNYQTLSRVDANKVVAGSSNYVTAKFIPISKDWERPITAIFNEYTVVLDKNNECVIPWEVLSKPGSFKVSAFCGDLHTADYVTVKVCESGYILGETPSEPSSSVYTQLVSECNIAQYMADLAIGNMPKTEQHGNFIHVSDAYPTYPREIEMSGKTVQNVLEHFCDEILIPTIGTFAISLNEDKSLHLEGFLPPGFETLPGIKNGYIPLLVMNGSVSYIGYNFKPETEYTISFYSKSNEEDCPYVNKMFISVTDISTFVETDSVGPQQTFTNSLTFTTPNDVTVYTPDYDLNPTGNILICGIADNDLLGHNINADLYITVNEGNNAEPWTCGISNVSESKIEYTGKNIIPEELYITTDKTVNGVNIKKLNDGSLKIYGTNTEEISYELYSYWGNSDSKSKYLINTMKHIPYTFSGGNNQNEYLTLELLDSGDSETTYSSNSINGVTFTPDHYKYVILSLILKPGAHNTIIYPQLEVGSSRTNYTKPVNCYDFNVNLKDYELRSLPDGYCDSIIITRKNNKNHVELIKRIKVYDSWNKDDLYWVPGSSKRESYFTVKVNDMLTTNAVLSSGYIGSEYTEENGCVYALSNKLVFNDNRIHNVNEAYQLLTEMNIIVIAGLEYPEIIDLGYIDVPELMGPCLNLWAESNNGDLDVKLKYVQDMDMVVKQMTQQILSTPTA